MVVDVDLEFWSGSAVVRAAGSDYQRQPVALYRDEPARLTERQAVFYRNLIRIAVATGMREIPVDFELPDGRRVFLDRGCIKIAEHAGFISSLSNGASGVVDSIYLAWSTEGR